MTLLIGAFVFLEAPKGHAREAEKAESANGKVQTLIDRAWAELDERMDVKHLDRSISLLKKALNMEPANHQILVELSNEHFHRGLQTSHATERKEYFKKGTDYAARALSIKETAGAHFWYAANLGKKHQDSGALSQASVFREITEHVDRAMEHDKDYLYGAPARFWMGVIIKAPPMVSKMVGPAPSDVYIDLRKSIARWPGYFENYLSQAEYYHYLGKEEEARRSLKKVITTDAGVMPQQKAMNRFSQKRAKKLWKKWTGKAWPQK
jgi:tetratricopeptide (TPR) repeat protein